MNIKQFIKSSLFKVNFFQSSYKQSLSSKDNSTLTDLQQKQNKPQINQNSNIFNQQDDIIVNPYLIANNTGKQINYSKLIQKFGCENINKNMLEKIQTLTQKPLHKYLKREIFFSHRDLNNILTAYQNHTDPNYPPFYLYTGRGPSSKSLHLGHLLPFIFSKYLQQSFNVPFIIQITDDQKYFHKQNGDLSAFTKLAYDNIKDILALDFDPQKTFIFIDSQYIGTLYPNVCKFQKNINLNTLKAIFGINFSDNCGKAAYPAMQAAPCLSSSFPHIFGNKNIPCLIPCGIDQDPYFRMTRDVCGKLKVPKPAGIYSKFFPSLQGFETKMSSSILNSGIFLTDPPKQIQKKINGAVSGGQGTKQQQQRYGADLSKDIPYQYLKFFMDDDNQLGIIAQQYSTGKMLTGNIKKILTKIIQEFVNNHQQKRAKLTDKYVQKFLSTHSRKFSYKINTGLLTQNQNQLLNEQNNDVKKKKMHMQKQKNQSVNK